MTDEKSGSYLLEIETEDTNLEGEDAKGENLFECIEIKNMNKGTINIPKYKYAKCTRESLK